ncbi:MAG: type I restriction enzyme HsdR N-terminal domain-containing protein [Magnetococcales bacterium]|nr:type I restriction enzyme HsdR N-terminal domain-containing protein [Magnetococcales bacterium]
MEANHRTNLDSTIRTLREQLQKIQNRTSPISEEDTKRVLITPLLQALRWNILDIDEVRNEFRSQPQDNPVDYALFLNRAPCLFLEAKAINHSIDERKWLSQIVGYAATAGVEWCVLTNGDEYRFYNAHAPVDVGNKLFKKVTISNAAQHKDTVEVLDLISKDRMTDKQINILWQAHHVDSRVKIALNEILQGDESLIRLIAKREPSLTQGDIRSSLQRADVRVTFPMLLSQPPSPPIPQTDSKQEENINYSNNYTKSSTKRPAVKDFLDAGLIVLPAHIEAEYKKRVMTASVRQDGSILFNGSLYPTPSAAGAAAVQRQSCNGWAFWSYRDSSGQLKTLSELRMFLENLSVDK